MKIKKVFVFSDLHLGDGSVSDDFGPPWHEKGTRDVKFIRKVTRLVNERGVDEIIANGDIYENHQFRMSKIRNAHAGLVTWIENNCRYIRGNHDYGLTGCLRYVLPCRFGTVLFAHGFENDPFMTSPISRVGVWCLKWVEKILPDVDSPERWKGIFTQKKNKDTKIVRMTREFAESFSGKHYAAVLGHTHTHGIENNGILYAKTGDCTHGKVQGILVDLMEGIFEEISL